MQAHPSTSLNIPRGCCSQRWCASQLSRPGGALVGPTPATFVLSTGSSHSMEDVAAESGPQPRWFQLYRPADRAVAAPLVQRAERSGYTAIVLTADAPTFGYRPTDLDQGYLPFPHRAGIANFTTDPVFRAAPPADADHRTVVQHWARVFANPTLTWDDLPWLRAATSLPILLKGIPHPDDARRALDLGAVDGVIVSNHGGRQLDGAVAALDVLPAVRAAVGAGVPVLLDSGVRTGSDVLKDLALGAEGCPDHIAGFDPGCCQARMPQCSSVRPPEPRRDARRPSSTPTTSPPGRKDRVSCCSSRTRRTRGVGRVRHSAPPVEPCDPLTDGEFQPLS